MAFGLGILVVLVVLLAAYLWRRLRKTERELAEWWDELPEELSPAQIRQRMHEMVAITGYDHGVPGASQTATEAFIMANEARLRFGGGPGG